MRVWIEQRWWAPGQPWAVFREGRWMSDWRSEAEAEAAAERLRWTGTHGGNRTLH